MPERARPTPAAPPPGAASTMVRFFAVCHPGLEPWVAAELEHLGAAGTLRHGGVEGSCSLSQLWQLHHGSNLAESFRVRLKSFVARDFGALEQGLARLPWHAYVRPEAPLRVVVSCKKSKLYHSDAVAERVRQVIDRRFAARTGKTPPLVTSPTTRMAHHEDDAQASGAPQTVFVRLERDEVTPSIDASGQRLHKRGYRQAVEVAPLRETLACAMARWLDELGEAAPVRVWDPFCGSGVLPLEWARLRSGIDPALRRGFAFEYWPMHPRQEYASWLARRCHDAESAGGIAALGSDVDPKAVDSATMNAALLMEQAGGAMKHCELDFRVGDFVAVAESIAPGTALLCNPPHGRRIGTSEHSLTIYQRIDALLQRRVDLRPVVMTCGAGAFVESSKLPWQVLARVRQGGMPLWFLGLGAGRRQRR